MDLFEKIGQKATHIADVFSETPGACAFFVFLFTAATVLCTRGLVGGLLEMHRSNSNLKKIYKNHGFWQKLILKPAWDDCIHAKGFCRFLIFCHNIRLVFFFVSLSLLALVTAIPSLMPLAASFSGYVFLLMDMPILVFHLVMDRYPFQRLRHEYRFKKYERTSNHHSLF